jgi:hypothetical protein
MTDPKCRWKLDDGGVYHTSCGNAIFIDCEGPVENWNKFCPYCGGTVIPTSRLDELIALYHGDYMTEDEAAELLKLLVERELKRTGRPLR